MSSQHSSTLKQISEKLGIATSTISRVLSGHAKKYRISEKTAKVILDYVRQENYTPNPLAKGLRLRKTNTIGLVVADVSNPFLASIASEITRDMWELGYSIMLCDSHENLAIEKQSIDLLWSRRVDGMIICSVGQSPDHLVKYADQRRCMVMVSRVFPNIGIPYVSSDDFAGSKLATEYLLDRGHRRIACLQGRRGVISSQIRVKGYEAALAARGLPFDPSLVVGDSFDEQGGYLDAKLLLSAVPDITAILAMSNPTALGTLRALAEEKRRVPEDISMIAFGEQPSFAYLATPLTAVEQSVCALGNAAVKILIERIATPETSERKANGVGLLLPVTLVERKSVRKIN